jgi:hypothetical protein
VNESFHFGKDFPSIRAVEVDSKRVSEYFRPRRGVFTLAKWRGDVRMARADRQYFTDGLFGDIAV